jgi:hypothetical protein
MFKKKPKELEPPVECPACKHDIKSHKDIVPGYHLGDCYWRSEPKVITDKNGMLRQIRDNCDCREGQSSIKQHYELLKAQDVTCEVPGCPV